MAARHQNEVSESSRAVVAVILSRRVLYAIVQLLCVCVARSQIRMSKST